MLKAIIIDDEEHARDLLADTIDHFKLPVHILAKCEDVVAAIEQINSNKPDFVFLDIEMPNYSGFELLDFFGEIDFEVVFVTAYSKYAIRAFEVSAVDYLLKPLQIDRLEAAIKKVEEKLTLKNSAERINTFKENIQSSRLTKIVLPIANNHQFIEIKNIVSIEAARAYCHLNLLDGRKILVSKSLSHFEEILSSHIQFVRVHRSFLINLHYVKHYSKKEQQVELINQLFVRISRERKDNFETHFYKLND